MGQSLYKACKYIILTGESGTASVGDFDVTFELYQQKDIDDNVAAIEAGTATGCTFGDSDESKVVLIADDTITVPEGFTLTPRYSKKSMVVMCNTLINNGTISMQAKGPNLLPHEWFILGTDDVYAVSADIIIPAYANNQTATYTLGSRITTGIKGNDGTNRQCGAGGMGGCSSSHGGSGRYHRNGSGTAFASGAGSGSIFSYGSVDYLTGAEVNTTYPMRGANGYMRDAGNARWCECTGGVGMPRGVSQYSRHVDGSTYHSANISDQNSGVGGRLIIFCANFENNGTVQANGTDGITGGSYSIITYGGASGGGAVDLFYNKFTNENEDMGVVTATGGMSGTFQSGGNGSVTPFAWPVKVIVKSKTKFLTQDNMLYFAQGFVNRFNEA